MYQYTPSQKKKLCMDDEDFMKFITGKFKSLRRREDLDDVFQEYRPIYKRKMEQILYPKVSEIEGYLKTKEKVVMKIVENTEKSQSAETPVKEPVVTNFFEKQKLQR